MKASRGLGLLSIALSAPLPLVAYSQVFLTEDQAAQAIFPGVKLTAKWVELTETEAQQVEKLSGENVRSRKVRALTGPKGETLYIDQVLGKHEFITYAVGVNPDGKVREIEILEYRETYGGQVRKPEWRKQFAGKDTAAPLKLNQDIQNISGATLSSAHLTAGVRRILRTHELLRHRL